MVDRPLIWVTENIHSDAMDYLENHAQVIGPTKALPPLASQIKGIIVRGHKVSDDLLAQLPQIEVIGKHGAGLDNIDLDAAQRRGISVVRADGANAQSVADLAIGLALMLLRGMDLHNEVLHQRLPKEQRPAIGFELSERRAGIIGVGAIGSRVAYRLSAGFDTPVFGYDPYLAQANWPANVARCDNLSDLLSSVDLLFLHVPLTSETQHMINNQTLASMPRGSVLVNCARGGIVDESALLQALNTHHLASAATDVFAQEPVDLSHPLLHVKGRLIATPHIGAGTHAALRRTGLTIAQKVIHHLT